MSNYLKPVKCAHNRSRKKKKSKCQIDMLGTKHVSVPGNSVGNEANCTTKEKVNYVEVYIITT